MTTEQTSAPEDIAYIIQFLRLLDRFKSVERRSYLSDHSRRESDAEHVWHMIAFALMLAPRIAAELDLLRAIELIFVHDLGEIFAGDTFAYSSNPDQHQNESAAFHQLVAGLPENDSSLLLSRWREYHEQVSPEAKFAFAIDRLQGFAQQIFADGKTWREFGITRTKTLARTDPIRSACPELNLILDTLYAEGDRRDLWPAAPHPERGKSERGDAR